MTRKKKKEEKNWAQLRDWPGARAEKVQLHNKRLGVAVVNNVLRPRR